MYVHKYVIYKARENINRKFKDISFILRRLNKIVNFPYKHLSIFLFYRDKTYSLSSQYGIEYSANGVEYYSLHVQ